jgi:hypothetical protein
LNMELLQFYYSHLTGSGTVSCQSRLCQSSTFPELSR